MNRKSEYFQSEYSLLVHFMNMDSPKVEINLGTDTPMVPLIKFDSQETPFDIAADMNNLRVAEASPTVGPLIRFSGPPAEDSNQDLQPPLLISLGTPEPQSNRQAPRQQIVTKTFPERLISLPSFHKSDETSIDIAHDEAILEQFVKTELEKGIATLLKVTDLKAVTKGGFGHVYSCTDLATGKKTAIKSISFNDMKIFYSTVEEWCKVVFKEVTFLQTMLEFEETNKIERVVRYQDHCWIVDDTPDAPQDHYLVIKTEWLPTSLHRVIGKLDANHHNIEPSFVEEILRSVCEAVQSLHKNMIVHHDLKPDNLMADFDQVLDFRFWMAAQLKTQLSQLASTINIIDMGLAKKYQSEQSLESNYKSGTFPFICPEKLGKVPYNPFLADAYAIGAIALDVATKGGVSRIDLMELNPAAKMRDMALVFEREHPCRAATLIKGLLEEEANRLSVPSVLDLLRM